MLRYIGLHTDFNPHGVVALMKSVKMPILEQRLTNGG
jgi:hypothetical protein